VLVKDVDWKKTDSIGEEEVSYKFCDVQQKDFLAAREVAQRWATRSLT
jgi:hypothetical protein